MFSLGSMSNPSRLCLENCCNRLKGHKGSCDKTPSEPLKGFPTDIIKKINKTKQTRGAQPYDRVPYQNRVNRCNKVVMPFAFRNCFPPSGSFENGYVIMVRPEEIIDPQTRAIRSGFPKEVIIGSNAFIFYDNKQDWNNYPPENYEWGPRRLTLNGEEINTRKEGAVDSGEYLARVPATTSSGEEGKPIVRGPPQGIRFYEYASEKEIWLCTMQLAYLAAKTEGLDEVAEAKIPSPHLEAICNYYNLNDDSKLEKMRVLRSGMACCPLCLEPIKASELMERAKQAEGREVVDLTITEANLFHIADLRPGEYNHIYQSLGWGHYHCNTVARDNGIEKTLKWMLNVLKNNNMIE